LLFQNYIRSLMLTKKIITVFLMLVLMIQLLPVKQVVRYFFVDNPTSEEIVEGAKSATKNFRFLDEDHHWLYGTGTVVSEAIPTAASAFLHFAEALPVFYSKDIHTPPPNFG
jgi:hypothetical protein